MAIPKLAVTAAHYSTLYEVEKNVHKLKAGDTTDTPLTTIIDEGYISGNKLSLRIDKVIGGQVRTVVLNMDDVETLQKHLKGH